jgi:copper(I)-binding protein
MENLMFSNLGRRFGVAIALSAGIAAFAQEYNAGDVRIGRPYASPSLKGVTSGAAYLSSLDNTGSQPDRLLRARAAVAGRVELHRMELDAQGVMRMRELNDLVVAPRLPIRMQPGMGLHLMLIDLKRPLKEGDSFPMTLEFERGGKVEVKVVVQSPKAPGGGAMPTH